MTSGSFGMCVLAAIASVTAACGGGAGGAAGGGAPGVPSAAEPSTFAEQTTVGQKLFGENCASCHGDAGEGGGKTPRVVGLDKGALPLDPPAGAKRTVKFKTAADVGDYAAKNMPPGQGGSLKAWEYWAIIAFDLKANGVTSDKKIDASSAKDIVLHK